MVLLELCSGSNMEKSQDGDMLSYIFNFFPSLCFQGWFASCEDWNWGHEKPESPTCLSSLPCHWDPQQDLYGVRGMLTQLLNTYIWVFSPTVPVCNVTDQWHLKSCIVYLCRISVTFSVNGTMECLCTKYSFFTGAWALPYPMLLLHCYLGSDYYLAYTFRLT